MHSIPDVNPHNRYTNHIARDAFIKRGRRSWKQRPFASSSGGEYIPIRRKKRSDIGPSFYLTKEEAVLVQLEALQNNDTPYQDAGVEVLYRFADFDPFSRSTYFGWSLDLGQFTRFQRVFHIMPFRLLLRHKQAKCLSSLQVSELEWRQRLLVTGAANEEAIFEITMVQRLGGHSDGVFYTRSLKAEPPWDPQASSVYSL